ncbi:hypothetical protein TCDM_13093 [Trypanosoma cruzi Dm28c]|uniref:Uncharacterized protein n=1 Tax=Trypanosoma cruzi Dm28c TaxID=1416333 RepID=V5AP65_TRYCR|nr:hypothetical protein TCDM_13093 [Trypanosoma cruzi Dm28c]
MEFHDGTVSCGWWNIYFSEATERERERAAPAAPAAGVVAAFCGLPCRLFCPLIMGGMPPLVTSSAGISQHQ